MESYRRNGFFDLAHIVLYDGVGTHRFRFQPAVGLRGPIAIVRSDPPNRAGVEP